MADLLQEESALNDVERKRHLATIERLTEQCGVPRIEVGKRYEAELERILVSTRVRDFLPILIARKIRQDLRSYEPAELTS
ncbi:MAG TPA: DUF3562 domain-containing protein [Burkholderiales bacterium]|nr:DUF3562 domain-containing protein [Burkholderiales bacterium]